MGGADHRGAPTPRPTSWSRPRTSTRSRWPGPPAGTSWPPRRPSASSAASTPTLAAAAAAAGRRPAAASSAAGVPDPGVTDVDLRRPRAPVRLDADPARPGWSGCPRPRQDVVDTLREIGCDVDDAGDGDDLAGAAAELAPRPAGRRRLRRGGRPPARLRPDPVRAAPAPGGPRADPRPAGTPRGRPHAGRPGLRRGAHLPLRRARRSTTSSGWRPTTRGATRCGWPTRCPRRRR